MKKKVVLIIIFSIFFINFVNGAIIKGNIYGPNLEILKDNIIDLQSNSKQTYVSKDGEYQFNVEPGKYIINAKHYEQGILLYSALENITIDNENEFILDLILIPSNKELFSENYPELDNLNFEEKSKPFLTNFWFILGFIILILISIYLLKNKKKISKDEEIRDDLIEVIKIIRENNGRINQKELRKKMSLSEAKISLMITDLESRKIIRKIKKGRGNILILKKYYENKKN